MCGDEETGCLQYAMLGSAFCDYCFDGCACVCDDPPEPPTEEHTIAPIVANHQLGNDYVRADGHRLTSHASLFDNGATLHVMRTTRGAVNGTYRAPSTKEKAVGIGSTDSKLATEGSYLYILEYTDADGKKFYSVTRRSHSPNAIADVESESRLVYDDKCATSFDAENGRIVRLNGEGGSMRLIMSANGLGWALCRPVTDRAEIVKVLRMADQKGFSVQQSFLCAIGVPTANAADPSVQDTATGTPVLPVAKAKIRIEPRNRPHPSTAAVGFADPRLAGLSGARLLARLHVALGHPSAARMLSTLKNHPAIMAKFTADDVKRFLEHGCAICNITKMRRAPHKPLDDPSRPPPGAEWSIDSLSLRVAARQFGFWHLTRFRCRGSTFKRLYGHKSLEQEVCNQIILRHLAWVQPVHGAVKRIKHDGFSSFTSAKWMKLLDHLLCNDQLSTPYAHEQIQIEQTWLHDVPMALAMIRAAKCNESDIYTAMVTQEACDNQLRKADGSPSACEQYYGVNTLDPRAMLIYGAQGTYLIDPEKRDSKFDDHAAAGSYRGPSRANQSGTACFMWNGNRHVTVDIADMKLYENNVLANCDQSSVTGNPFAVSSCELGLVTYPCSEPMPIVEPPSGEAPPSVEPSTNAPTPSQSTPTSDAEPAATENGADDVVEVVEEGVDETIAPPPSPRRSEPHTEDRPQARHLAHHDANAMLRGLGVTIGTRVTWCRGESSGILERAIPCAESSDGEGRVGIRMDNGSLLEIIASGVRPADGTAADALVDIDETTPSPSVIGDDASRVAFDPIQAGERVEFHSSGDGKDTIVGVVENIVETSDRQAMRSMLVRGENGLVHHVNESNLRRAGPPLPPALTRGRRDIKAPIRLDPVMSGKGLQAQHRQLGGAAHPHANETQSACARVAEGLSAEQELSDLVAAIGVRENGLSDLHDDELKVSVAPAVIVERLLFDVGDNELVSKHVIVTMTEEGYFEYDPLDVSLSSGWHVPTNEPEYYRSPQREMWYQARRRKMDAYESVPVWQLVPLASVPRGTKIYNVKWVQRIKNDENGNFREANPRLCMVGTSMDPSVYDTFANYMRMSSMKLVMIVTRAYRMFEFQIDDTDAFQNTPVDPNAPTIYSRQAPGFIQTGESGEPMVYKMLMCLQGGIHSANMYDSRKVKTLLTEVGMRQAVWDRRVFIYHVGPLASTAANLTNILASLRNGRHPDVDGRPAGYAIFGTHADDGVGGADSERTAKYIQGAASTVFACKLTGWRRPLGFSVIDHKDGSFSLEIPGYLERLMSEHCASELKITPPNVMKKTILNLEPVEPPAAGSPEHAEYIAMQDKAKSLKGALMWSGHAWPQVLPPTNRVCRFMHQPSHDSYKHAKYALMHVSAYPVSPRFAPKECSTLELASPTVPPFAEGAKEWGLHMLVDSNKEVPRCVTGVDILFGGAVIDTTSVRQHHTSPDVHAGEVHAACYAVGKLIPIRELAHEIGVLQVAPTPVWFDSASTIFVVRNEMCLRRSSWLLGKLAFVHEAKYNGAIEPRKVNTALNTADGKTKPIDTRDYWRHITYTHNVSESILRDVYGVTVKIGDIPPRALYELRGSKSDAESKL